MNASAPLSRPAPVPAAASDFAWNKMKRYIVMAALVLPVPLTSGCVDPRKDLARFQAVSVEADKAEYFRQAQRFVKSAQTGDVEELMRLTSPLRLKLKGTRETRHNYKTELIPAFRNSRVEWVSDGKIIFDSNYNPGLDFAGMIHGSDTTPFYISLLKEDGKIVVASIRTTEKPQP